MREKQVRKKRKISAAKAEKGRVKQAYFDYTLVAIIIFLVCFGLIMLYSTSSYSARLEHQGNHMYLLERQFKFSLLGIAGMLIVSKIPYHVYAYFAKPIYYIAFFLMMLVRTPMGIEVNGARRWLRIPGGTMQPAEVVKIAIVLLIAYLICEYEKAIVTRKALLTIFAWGIAASIGLYLLTENLSTAIIVFGMTCVMVFVAYPKSWPFVTAGGAVILGGFLLRKYGERIIHAIAGESDSFRIQRVLMWLDPGAYDKGFQVVQGLYAVGSGGFFGKGLGKSVQKMIIPEAQNDMIFSIICEELGVFGAMVVLLLFGLLLYRLLFVAQNAPDIYGMLLVTGIMAHITIQVVLNVAVVLNLIPTTGITLPFISAGGTSIVFLLAEMGIALSVSNSIELE